MSKYLSLLFKSSEVDFMNKKLFVQIFKFVIVGGIATLIDWSIYYVLFNIFKVNPLIANIGSFTISVIYNFIASVKWVFEVNENKSKSRLFTEFIVFSLIGLFITELLIYVGINYLKMDAMIIKIVATIIVMVFNFITRKIFLE